MAVRPGLATAAVLAASACASSSPSESKSDDLHVDLAAPPGDGPVSSFAVWQGWRMRWGYNHRMNRAGGLVEQVPCNDEDIERGDACRARLTLAAASGSGPDRAEVENRVALVATRGVQAVSAAREFVLRGLEEKPLLAAGDVSIPLGPAWRSYPHMVAILSGFDAGSLGSADKLIRLSVHIGEPREQGDQLRVPVEIEGIFSCSSSECPPMDRVDLSLLIGVTVLASDASALEAKPVSAANAYAWAKKEPVPKSATSTAVALESASTETTLLAMRGFEVELDEEMHLLEFGLSVDLSDELLFTELRNWRPGMRNSRRPYSFFSYAQAGAAEWAIELVRLDFRSAAVERVAWKSQIDWRPKGRHAFDPLAEQTRMVHWKVDR